MATDDSSAPAHTTTDPNTRAGDPFAYAGDKPRGCFACYVGWVYTRLQKAPGPLFTL